MHRMPSQRPSGTSPGRGGGGVSAHLPSNPRRPLPVYVNSGTYGASYYRRQSDEKSASLEAMPSYGLTGPCASEADHLFTDEERYDVSDSVEDSAPPKTDSLLLQSQPFGSDEIGTPVNASVQRLINRKSSAFCPRSSWIDAVGFQALSRVAPGSAPREAEAFFLLSKTTALQRETVDLDLLRRLLLRESPKALWKMLRSNRFFPLALCVCAALVLFLVYVSLSFAGWVLLGFSSDSKTAPAAEAPSTEVTLQQPINSQVTLELEALRRELAVQSVSLKQQQQQTAALKLQVERQQEQAALVVNELSQNRSTEDGISVSAAAEEAVMKNLESIQTSRGKRRTRGLRAVASVQRALMGLQTQHSELAHLVYNLQQQQQEHRYMISQEVEQLQDQLRRLPKTSDANTISALTPDFLRKVEDLYNHVLLDGETEVDWALESIGARIAHRDTSPPLVESSLWSNLLPSWLGTPSQQSRLYRPAETVLNPERRPGNCFAFAGKKGTISIILPTAVYVRSVAVDDMMSSFERTTAPKSFRVWGIPDSRAFEPHPSGTAAEERRADANWSRGAAASDAVVSTKKRASSVETDSKRVLLGEFSILQNTKLAVFTTTPQRQPLQRITFEFLDNFGNSKYTCVYRLRVYGDKAVPVGSASGAS